MRQWICVWAVWCLAALSGGVALAAESEASVDGFKVRYAELSTPKAEWDEESAPADWFARFKGRLESSKPLTYRKATLPPGKHDVWVEKGKGEWFYLVIGARADDESPRLKAQFKLYDQDSGVDTLRLDLKLVRKATKLKFSIRAGKVEGHGNLRITTPAD